MKNKFMKMKNFLNKDVDEFNKVILSVICITILVVAGIISYTITNSYAIFSSSFEGTKTLKFHPTKEFSVYSFNTNYVFIGSDLEQGEHTGYCLVQGLVQEAPEPTVSTSPNNKLVPVLLDTTYDYNTCTDAGYGFLTQAACESEATRVGGTEEGYSCITGSWESSGFDYTTDYTALNSPYFLKHNIDSSNRVESSEVCFIYGSGSGSGGATPKSNKEPNKKITPINLLGTVGEVYCLKGGDEVYDSSVGYYVSPSYAENKALLQEVFGASNCNEIDSNYECSSGSLSAHVDSSGSVEADVGDCYCGVNGHGYSRCESGGGGGVE